MASTPLDLTSCTTSTAALAARPTPLERAPTEPCRVLLPTTASPVRAEGRYCGYCSTFCTAVLPAPGVLKHVHTVEPSCSTHVRCPLWERDTGTAVLPAPSAVQPSTPVGPSCSPPAPAGGPAVNLCGYEKKHSSTARACLLSPLQVSGLRRGRLPGVAGSFGCQPTQPPTVPATGSPTVRGRPCPVGEARPGPRGDRNGTGPGRFDDRRRLLNLEREPEIEHGLPLPDWATAVGKCRGADSNLHWNRVDHDELQFQLALLAHPAPTARDLQTIRRGSRTRRPRPADRRPPQRWPPPGRTSRPTGACPPGRGVR